MFVCTTNSRISLRKKKTRNEQKSWPNLIHQCLKNCTMPLFARIFGIIILSSSFSTIIYHYHSKQTFSLFIGRQPTKWPANNCLQIMVCSCVKETVPFSFLRLLLRENGRSLRFPRIFIKKKKTPWWNDKTIIELGDRRSIICLSFRTQNKSRYFAITEFNNYFIIRSLSLVFYEYPWEAKRSAIFT